MSDPPTVDFDMLMVELPALDSRYGGNSRALPRERNRLAQEAKADARYAIQNIINRRNTTVPWPAVTVDVTWLYANAAHRPDPDNAISRVKYYLDGAVLAGLIPNDTPDHIVRLALHYERASKPGIRLTFVRIDEEEQA